tara:strand:+ start:283 stop:939 length:657 start_codon:yes stop_codon:yes gene_type:complete
MAVITNFGVPTDAAAGTTLMPKLQYRFRVSFTNMGSVEGQKMRSETTQNVISCSRPNLTHEEVVVDSYNSKMYLAGKHTWEPVTVVLRDDMNSNVIKSLGSQLNRQVDHADQSSSIAGSAYKFECKIETLDGDNSGIDSAGVFDTWELIGCFISNIQYGDLNYADSNMVQVTAVLRFDHATHTIDGDDWLSKGEASSGKNDTGATGTQSNPITGPAGS